jgi:hypothetical protein
MRWTRLHGPAKVLVICVAVLLLSAGLCGLQWTLVNGHGLPSNALIITGIIEIVGMVLSAAAGFVALVIWGFGAIFRRSREP